MDETYNKWPFKKTSVCYWDFGFNFSSKCLNPLKNTYPSTPLDNTRSLKIFVSDHTGTTRVVEWGTRIGVLKGVLNIDLTFFAYNIIDFSVNYLYKLKCVIFRME